MTTGRKMQAAEEDRGGKDQLAARLMELAGGDPLGLIDLLEDAPGRSQVHGACVGERHFAGRAVRSLVPRWDSSSFTLRLTVASGMPNCRLAAEKLPASATRSTIDIASRRSMIIPFNGNGFPIIADYHPV